MNLNEEDIAQYFGSIGVIKNDKRTGKVFRWKSYTEKDA